MSTTLRALTTLALERGRADTGQVFQLHSKTAAAELVAAGLAEVVKPNPDAALLDDAPAGAVASSLTIAKAEAQKEDKEPTRTKEEKTALKTK